MKKLTLAALALVAGMAANAQVTDPVIMTINGKDILRSEFEYSFNKNNSEGVLDKKTVKEYVPLYVDFKLKVAEAESQKIDTISSIQKELAGYREQILLPTLVDSAFIENEARKTYDNTVARFGGMDLLTASHIMKMVRQDAPAEQDAAAKATMDSIYNVLKATPTEELEAKFSELATKLSDDTGSAQRGGSLGQFGKGMMVPEFENAAFELQNGQFSSPVKSAYGWHVIYLKDRHPFEPYEYHHESILKFLESRGIKELSASHYVDSLAKLENVTRQEEVDKLFAELISRDAELRNLSQEYYDGTLMYEVSKADVWDKAQQDTEGLEKFFNANKKNYKWDSPKFSGIIIRGKDVETIAKAKALLKGVAEEDWAKTITSSLNTDSVKVVRVERGLFKVGDNPIIDKLVFNAKDAKEIKENKTYPCYDVYGKKLSKPRSYNDVRGQVTTDYQNMMEKNWVESLRQKFSYNVDEAVVETVNDHK